MTTTNDQLAASIDRFVSKLGELMRAQALEAVAEALGQVPHPRRVSKGAQAPAVAKRGPGRPPKAAAAPAAKAAAPSKRKTGEKRPPEQLAKLVETVAEYVKGNPGQGVEQISKSMGVPTKDLALPIRKLLAEKRISSKGQKRATKYFGR